MAGWQNGRERTRMRVPRPPSPSYGRDNKHISKVDAICVCAHNKQQAKTDTNPPTKKTEANTTTQKPPERPNNQATKQPNNHPTKQAIRNAAPVPKALDRPRSPSLRAPRATAQGHHALSRYDTDTYPQRMTLRVCATPLQ